MQWEQTTRFFLTESLLLFDYRSFFNLIKGKKWIILQLIVNTAHNFQKLKSLFQTLLISVLLIIKRSSPKLFEVGPHIAEQNFSKISNCNRFLFNSKILGLEFDCILLRLISSEITARKNVWVNLISMARVLNSSKLILVPLFNPYLALLLSHLST